MGIVRVVVAITAFGLVINASTDTFGHDTHSHSPHSRADKDYADATSRSRMWTIKSLTGDGTPTMVKASLLTADHDQIRLQTLDGRVISTSSKTLTAEDLKFVHQLQERVLQLNTQPFVRLTAFQSKDNQGVADPPALASFFKPFAKTIRFHWDRDFLFVESTGMPDHPMMTGITAWQQQVPLPQAYTGNNAWKIPLHPVPAQNPMSTKEHFFRVQLPWRSTVYRSSTRSRIMARRTRCWQVNSTGGVGIVVGPTTITTTSLQCIWKKLWVQGTLLL